LCLGWDWCSLAKELAARQTNLVLVARSEAKLQLAQQLQDQYKIQIEVLVQDLTAPSGQSCLDAVTQKD